MFLCVILLKDLELYTPLTVTKLRLLSILENKTFCFPYSSYLKTQLRFIITILWTQNKKSIYIYNSKTIIYFTNLFLNATSNIYSEINI